MSNFKTIKNDTAGFSLIETLVAVFILSVVSLISLNVMSSFADANQLMTVKVAHLEEIRNARSYLRDDLRNVRKGEFYVGNDVDGGRQRIFYLTRVNSEIANVDDNLSSAESIEYILSNYQLVRRSYDRPNALAKTGFRDYVLLNDVREIELRYFDGALWQKTWQIPANNVNKYQPRALEVAWHIGGVVDGGGHGYRNRFQLGSGQ